MNKPIKTLMQLVASGTLLAFAQNAHSQLVATGNLYQNAAPGSQNAVYNDGNSEEGNQIVLAGTATSDIITSFSFQYDYSSRLQSLPLGMADVRFYANDGAPVAGYASPGTVLFDSGAFPIVPTTGATENFFPGDFTGTGSGIVGGGLGVLVPQDFTWTVTFSGLQTGEDAGLALYDPIQVGANGLPNGDAWVNTGTGLMPANDSGSPLEFGAVFNGVPAPDTSCLSVSVLSVLAGFRWMKRFQRRA